MFTCTDHELLLTLSCSPSPPPSPPRYGCAGMPVPEISGAADDLPSAGLQLTMQWRQLGWIELARAPIALKIGDPLACPPAATPPLPTHLHLPAHRRRRRCRPVPCRPQRRRPPGEAASMPERGARSVAMDDSGWKHTAQNHGPAETEVDDPASLARLIH